MLTSQRACTDAESFVAHRLLVSLSGSLGFPLVPIQTWRSPILVSDQAELQQVRLSPKSLRLRRSYLDCGVLEAQNAQPHRGNSGSCIHVTYPGNIDFSKQENSNQHEEFQAIYSVMEFLLWQGQTQGLTECCVR